MDSEQFDRLARLLASPRSRRTTLRALLGSLGAFAGSDRASAQFEDHCQWPQTSCGGSCCNILSGERCQAGRCVCRYGQISCNGFCVNPSSDITNCGSCGVRCAIYSGERCQGGRCIGRPEESQPAPAQDADSPYAITPVGPPEWASSLAIDISEDRQVVGLFDEDLDTSEPRRFHLRGGTATDLTALGMAEVIGFESDDEVVGWDEAGNLVQFRPDTGRVEPHPEDPKPNIPVPAGFARVEVYRTNRRGESVGVLLTTEDGNDLTGARGFVATGGEVTVLDPAPGGETSRAWTINDAGLVAGGPADDIGRAFLYDALSGRTTDLGTLPGFANSFPYGLNSAGLVVGRVTSEPDGERHPFVFDPGTGTMTDLNDLIAPQSGWELRLAAGINDAGWIVGAGQLDNRLRAFLLTPRAGN